MKNIIKNVFARKGKKESEKRTVFITVSDNWGKEISPKTDGLQLLSTMATMRA